MTELDDDQAENEQAAIAELIAEMTALHEAGEQVPPPLIARLCRLMPDDEYRIEFRVMLHVVARSGDEEAAGALRLLADDEWWSTTPDVLRLWPPLGD